MSVSIAPPAPLVAVPRATWSLPRGPLALASQRSRYLLVVDGLVKREVTLQGNVASELLGPEDCLALDAPEEDPLGTQVRVTAMTPVRVASLDAPMLARLTPTQLGTLVRRSGAQASRMALHRAVLQLPRVEDRLLALMRLLAARFGRVTPDGVRVPLSLNHAELGHLVGARRPTISLAAKLLTEKGTLRRLEDGSWLLRTPELTARAAAA